MKKGVALLFVGVLLIAAPALVGAQGGWSLPGMQTLFGAPGKALASWGCSSGGFAPYLRANAKFGYQRYAASIDFPLNTAGFTASLYPQSGLNLKLHGAGIWVGGVGIDLVLHPSVVLYATLDASIPKNIGIEAEGEPFWGGSQTVDWDGQTFQWWGVDAGGIFAVWNDWSILAGLKRERFYMDLSSPTGIGVAVGGSFNYTANMDVGFWIPYVGLGHCGPNFKLYLLASPVAIADVTIPLSFGVSRVLQGFGQADSVEEAKYRFNKAGVFLEARLDYSVQVPTMPAASVTGWGKATWLSIKGGASEDYNWRSNLPQFSVSQSGGTGDGKYSASTLAAGITANLSFWSY
ncbi:hypothetical protein ACFL2Q_01700 [Thermodesulfobacteriota bacterium]